MRSTSFSLQQFNAKIEERALRATARARAVGLTDDRPWSRPAGGVDDRPFDNYPVYHDISTEAIPGTWGGVIGGMRTGQ